MELQDTRTSECLKMLPGSLLFDTPSETSSCAFGLARTRSPSLMTISLDSQTPTLNAAPIVRGVIEACAHGGKNKQGIQVTMILGLGFNDKGESVPFQGGTNEVSGRADALKNSALTLRRAGGRLPIVQTSSSPEEGAEPPRLLVHW